MFSFDMSDFASRLRKHRQMLNVSQQTLAETCGISWRHQRDYESGLLKPDSTYLNALAKAGMDVAYLTTGEFQAVGPNRLSQREFAFLQNYEQCSLSGQVEIFVRLMILSAWSHERRESYAALIRLQNARPAANDSFIARQ